MGWDLLCTLLSSLTGRDGLYRALNDLSKKLVFPQTPCVETNCRSHSKWAVYCFLNAFTARQMSISKHSAVCLLTDPTPRHNCPCPLLWKCCSLSSGCQPSKHWGRPASGPQRLGGTRTTPQRRWVHIPLGRVIAAWNKPNCQCYLVSRLTITVNTWQCKLQSRDARRVPAIASFLVL